jgi:uncharacterized protein (TIGR02145 family)
MGGINMNFLCKLFGKEDVDKKSVTTTVRQPAPTPVKRQKRLGCFYAGGGLSMHTRLRLFVQLLLTVCGFICFFLGTPTNGQTSLQGHPTEESLFLFRVLSVSESPYLELKTAYGFSGSVRANSGCRYVIVRLDFATEVDSIDNSMLLLVGDDNTLFKSDGLGDEEEKFCVMSGIILKRDDEDNFCSLCAMTSGGPVSLVMFKTKQPAVAFVVPQTVPLSSLQISYQKQLCPLLINGQDSKNTITEIDGQKRTVTVTDIDGNVYRTVKIGNQWWMAENLKVTHYRNGDAIPNVINNTTWAGLKTGAYCAYDNIRSNVDTYGYLYNCHAVSDSRNIAPSGWHVPTDDEWKELEIYLGMSSSETGNSKWRGTNEGGKLKESGTTHWSSPNSGATNESGFCALPAGCRYNSGDFANIISAAYFWSTSNYLFDVTWYRGLGCNDSGMYRLFDNNRGFSIRCIRNEP